MGDILDEAGHKLGSLGQDGYVYTLDRKKIGRVLDNGDVQDTAFRKIGSYDGDGKVYEQTRHIGTIKSDGKIYDHENDMVGHVKGDHIMGGGAALLLLFR